MFRFSTNQLLQLFNEYGFDKEYINQFVRTVGYTYAQCADIGESFVALCNTNPHDFDTWYHAWHDVAKRVQEEAQSSLVSGDVINAKLNFLKASEYYRQSAFFLRVDLEDSRLLEASSLAHDCFVQAIRLFDAPVNEVSIPYEGSTFLPGYFFYADRVDTPKPLVIIIGGYDGWMSEGYPAGAAAALARGYNALVFDGPGQGSMLIHNHVYLRPDFEVVMARVIEWLQGFPGVDSKRIIVIGRSLGSYLAGRAATKVQGIAALVCDPGLYNLFERVRERIPSNVIGLLERGEAAAVNTFFAELFKTDHMMEFFIKSRAVAHGLKTPYEYLKALEEYTFEDDIEAISCPTLVCDNSTDSVIAHAEGQREPQVMFEKLACPKAYFEFQAEHGAGMHCEAGASSQFNTIIYNWLSTLFN